MAICSILKRLSFVESIFNGDRIPKNGIATFQTIPSPVLMAIFMKKANQPMCSYEYHGISDLQSYLLIQQ